MIAIEGTSGGDALKQSDLGQKHRAVPTDIGGENVNKCPKCGEQSSGKYCATCGTRLHKSVLGDAIREFADVFKGEPPLGSGERFKRLKTKLKKRGDVQDSGALAAWIGRKKHGAKKMARMAAAGRPSARAQGEGKSLARDTAYIDHVGGRYEAHTYSDGQRVHIGTHHDSDALHRKLERKGYK